MKKQLADAKIFGLILSLCAALLWSAAAATDVSAQLSIPKGSYQETCKNIGGGFNKQNAMIIAECRRKDGSYTPQTRIERYYLCENEIRNDDGKLNCTMNENKPAYQHAKKAADEASQTVYGVPLKGSVDYWIGRLLTGGKLDAQFYDSAPLLKYTFAGMMKKDFQSSPGLPEEVIKRMALAVYGREQPQLTAPYKQELLKGEKGYDNIVTGETIAMNQNPLRRRYMINNVYSDAMGRNAKKGETDHWLPRTENYGQIIGAARNWLYSDAGATDLRATAKAAYKVNNGKDASDADLEGMIKLLKATGKKLIYVEMIGSK